MKSGKEYEPEAPPRNPPAVHTSKYKYTVKVILSRDHGLCEFDMQCDYFAKSVTRNGLGDQLSSRYVWKNSDATYLFDTEDVLLITRRLNPGWTEEEIPESLDELIEDDEKAQSK